MATFLYKGYTDEGVKVGGAKQFNNMEEMEKFVDTLNINGIEIFTSETKFSKKELKYVKHGEISLFCKQMSVVFFSQLSLAEGISMLADQTDNDQLKIALQEITDFVEQGYIFSDVIAMYNHIFGTYLCNMVLIGESSGTLDRIFDDLSEYFEKESKVRKKIKTAVTYPLFLAVIMSVIIAVIVKSVLPIFDTMLMSMGAEPSVFSKGIISVTRFIDYYGRIFIVFVIIFAISLKLYFKTEKGEYNLDKIKVTWPIFRNVYNRIIISRYSNSLAILLKSGSQIVNSVEQSNVLIQNKYLEDKFEKVYQDVRNGKSLSDALEETGIFPNSFIKMTVIGEKTGNLDAMLNKTASVFSDEVDNSIEKATRFIEPILISVLSLIVGIILLAILVPMIDIMQFI